MLTIAPDRFAIITLAASREVQKGAGDVRLHLPAPVLARHLDQRLVEDAAGIVHQDVQRAEGLDRQGHRPFRRAIKGEVRHRGLPDRPVPGP